MGKAKGGRGVKADYGETKQVRIPPALMPQVIELRQRYYDYLDAGGKPETPPLFIGGSDKIVSILEPSLKLPPNAGGAIKEKIREALRLLQG